MRLSVFLAVGVALVSSRLDTTVQAADAQVKERRLNIVQAAQEAAEKGAASFQWGVNKVLRKTDDTYGEAIATALAKKKELVDPTNLRAAGGPHVDDIAKNVDGVVPPVNVVNKEVDEVAKNVDNVAKNDDVVKSLTKKEDEVIPNNKLDDVLNPTPKALPGTLEHVFESVKALANAKAVGEMPNKFTDEALMKITKKLVKETYKNPSMGAKFKKVLLWLFGGTLVGLGFYGAHQLSQQVFPSPPEKVTTKVHN
ncbi:hypothetical protein CCR75_008373 [Bremia lactucae]|uniref:RxLR effector protein n=1 Tax=Bremia lactucae TaxID=4779 RepID=A0A976FGU1_BRELC|nr:hypothetical protein CCR75_008373 [Bremia lactucae]